MSDIVSSTHLLEAAGPGYLWLLVRHRALVAAAVERQGGEFLSHAGDSTLAVFDRPENALVAAVEAQQALGAEPWPDGLAVRVRMGVHTGDVYDAGGEPVGLAINHGARVMAAAAPGQVTVSPAVVVDGVAARLARAGVVLADAGRHTMRDHTGPVRLRQVVADGVTVVVPPPPAQVPGVEPVVAGAVVPASRRARG
ncbi:MAG: adenylate/guanylate cyclase domain-containing protein [Acidimicrobiales bacterium]|nr:adenylate/guanylate cyclase domain-containing protein [Acidimicrobiales bacterium]